MLRTIPVLSVLLAGLSFIVVGCGNRPLANSSASPGDNSSVAPLTHSAAVVADKSGASAVSPSATGSGSISKEVLPVELVPQLGHGLGVDAIAISPDGKVAATASADCTVRVWDVESGILLRVISIGEQVHDVAILPDGERAIVVASVEAQLWDLARGRLLTKFKTNKSDATRVRLLHHSNRAVFGDASGGVALWDLTQQKLVRQLTASQREGIRIVEDMDVSFDDRVVAVTQYDGTLQVIEVESGRLLHNLKLGDRNGAAARFSKNGERLTSFGKVDRIRQWDVKTGQELQSFDTPVRTGALATDDTAVIGDHEGLKLLDLKTGNPLRTLEPWPGVSLDAFEHVAVTPDGRRSVSSTHDGAVLFSNISDGTPIHATPVRRAGAFSLAVSPRGDHLAVSFGGGEVDVWDAVTAARTHRLPYVNDTSISGLVTFSPDGRLLLRTVEKAVYVTDVRSGELIRKFEAPSRYMMNAIAVSPNGKLIAMASGKWLTVFELDTGRSLWTYTPEANDEYSSAAAVAFTPDNGQIVLGASARGVRIYNVSNGAEVFRFDGPKDGAESIDFWDKNTLLLGADGLVALWDLRTGQFLR